ncbi:MAG: GNAT family N-acetyltransferase [Rubripirellula sp.]
MNPSAESKAGHRVDDIRVLGWGELTQNHKQIWEQIRTTEASYRTPFFSTSFTDAVHAVRGDVLVAVLHCDNEAIGFLPYHQIGKVALPAGRFFNDAHSVIISPEHSFDWYQLLKQCGLKAYDFHALVGHGQALDERFSDGTTESFSAELGDDSQVFLQQLERSHKTIRRQEQKTRKMEREVGPLSLEIDCRDKDLLAQTIDWKRQQYRRTNILDLFTPTWTRDLLHQLHATPEGSNRGILSILRAGDEIVAAHIGMIEGDLLHYWFPAYNVDFSRYSPGTALFKSIIRAASEHGIKTVDMGYGEQPYKRKQTDTITTVSHGCVTQSSVYRNWKRAKKAAGGVLRKVPMKEQLKAVLRVVQPNAGISKLE